MYSITKILRKDNNYSKVNKYIDTYDIENLIYDEPYTVICILRDAFEKVFENLLKLNNVDSYEKLNKIAENMEKDLKQDIGEMHIMLALNPFIRTIKFDDAKAIYEKIIIIILKIEEDYY